MSRYDYTKTTTSQLGKRYYSNNVYPDIPFSDGDNYVITTIGDRLDLLALDFYNDDSLWWVIASANGLAGDSIYPPLGYQLRIPMDVRSIINDYNQTNVSR
jgi:hypothetical protein